MSDLWDAAKDLDTDRFAEIRTTVNEVEENSIEELLSKCQSALPFLDSKQREEVEEFLSDVKKMIAEKCRSFIKHSDLTGHKKFLSRITRRRPRASRVKLFTTNYDLCFEEAASQIGMVMIDGFSFSVPRRYNPAYFDYDVIRRKSSGDELSDYVANVIHLVKLHGSVNWVSKTSEDALSTWIEQSEDQDDPYLIYPASSKYENSYSQPYLEMMSQFLTGLRQPNTSLITIGFGYNDDHITEPIIAAVQSNPSFSLINVDPYSENWVENKSHSQIALKKMIDLGASNISLLQADFQQFSEIIPDLKALSPDQELAYLIRKTAQGNS